MASESLEQTVVVSTRASSKMADATASLGYSSLGENYTIGNLMKEHKFQAKLLTEF